MAQGQPPHRILIGFRLVDAIRDVLDGVGAYVRQNQLRWQIQCVDANLFPMLLGRATADGAITVIDPRSKLETDRVRQANVPTVNMLRDLSPGIPSVLSDNMEIGRVAARDFLRRGFRRFGFVGFDAVWSVQREQGFAQSLKLEGHDYQRCEATAKIGKYTELARKAADRSLVRWVAGLKKPIAILAASDAIGVRVLSACAATNAAVPGEIAVMGVDNFVHTCEFAPVPMSSIAQNFTRMGFEAASLLDRMIKRTSLPHRAVTVPPGAVVERRSTNVFAFEDQHVTAAMRMIHDNSLGIVHIKQLLTRVAVSRRWLDARFKALVGHPVSEEIRRLRLERLRQLLLHTDLSIKQIALRSGFSRPENMVRFFRNSLGVPPQSYRLQHHENDAALK